MYKILLFLFFLSSGICKAQTKINEQHISTTTVESGNKISETTQQYIDRVLKQEWIDIRDTSIAGITYFSKELITSFMDENDKVNRIWIKNVHNQYKKNDPLLNNATVLIMIDMNCAKSQIALCTTYILDSNGKLVPQTHSQPKGWQTPVAGTLGDFWMKQYCSYFNK